MRAEILALCDAVRDEALPALGVAVKDGASGAVWRVK
jgi:hypothetical protein